MKKSKIFFSISISFASAVSYFSIHEIVKFNKETSKDKSENLDFYFQQDIPFEKETLSDFIKNKKIEKENLNNELEKNKSLLNQKMTQEISLKISELENEIEEVYKKIRKYFKKPQLIKISSKKNLIPKN